MREKEWQKYTELKKTGGRERERGKGKGNVNEREENRLMGTTTTTTTTTGTNQKENAQVKKKVVSACSVSSKLNSSQFALIIYGKLDTAEIN